MKMPPFDPKQRRAPKRAGCMICQVVASEPTILKPGTIHLFGAAMAGITTSGQITPVGFAICTKCLGKLAAFIRSLPDLNENGEFKEIDNDETTETG